MFLRIVRNNAFDMYKGPFPVFEFVSIGYKVFPA